jgi:tetratricopeptide (TPR) repeat protein
LKFQYQNRNSALDDFNKAIQLKIVYCKADFEKGLDKFFLQDFSGAYLDFSQALVKPITGKVFYNDALEKYKNEEYEVAGQYFTKAIQLGILDWDLFYLRAMCNYSLQNYTIALPDFNEAIKLNSSFVGLYYYRGGTNFSL